MGRSKIDRKVEITLRLRRSLMAHGSEPDGDPRDSCVVAIVRSHPHTAVHAYTCPRKRSPEGRSVLQY